MAYLTFSYLKQKSESVLKGIVLHEALEKRASSMTKVFLSHRHTDKKIVEDVIGFLTDLGADVYIDVLDYLLPDKTDGKTAIRIKQKIKGAKKLILLATPNSLDSKWIPWELGLGDAMKGLDNIAILPLLVEGIGWAEREYYQIYGTIKADNKGTWGYFPPGASKGTLLKSWLKNSSSLLEG